MYCCSRYSLPAIFTHFLSQLGAFASRGAIFAAVFITVTFCDRHEGNPTFMSTPELLEHWGYHVENHTVKTEDGYLLTMHRIPNPNSKYYPIIVQHGILLASDVWVLRGPKEDLVLLLADRGFDVWLANTRGNFYSKKHSTHRSIQKRYWDFGWDEVGEHDIPAMIGYVQSVTKTQKVIHMGHSMGTTSFYAMLSNKPEMNENIAAHVSLAPVAYMYRMKCLQVLRPLTIMINQLIDIQHMLRLYDLFGRDRRISLFISRICNSSKRNKYLCYRIMFYIIGPDFKQLRPEIFDRFIGHFPSGASSTQFLHFIQNVNSREFREFNYGPVLNVEKYGQTIPPLYNLTKVTAPVYLYYSTNDYLTHNLISSKLNPVIVYYGTNGKNVESDFRVQILRNKAKPSGVECTRCHFPLLFTSLDVDRLADQLPNVKKKYLVPDKLFNHLDFILATNSMTLLYDDIIKTLETFVMPLR